MSIFDSKTNKSVAEAVMKVLEAELKGNQHKIDANKNGKVDAHDFKLLRAKKTMKEEEQLDELSKATVKSYVMKKMDKMSDEPVSKNQYGYAKKDVKGMTNAYNRLKNYKPTSEEVEQVEEGWNDRMDDPNTTPEQMRDRADMARERSKNQPTGQKPKPKNSTYTLGFQGKSKTVVMNKEEVKELDEAFPTVADGEKNLRAKEGKTSKGTLIKTKTGVKHERDYDDQQEPEEKRGRGRPKKRLGEMRQEWLEFMEEVDNETFTKELKDQKAKFDGKKKGADVAKPSVQAVKQEEVETPSIHVRSMYTKHYAKHGGTISKAKEASTKAYDAVEKMHGKEMRDKLQAFHRKNMNEETEQIDEVSLKTATSAYVSRMGREDDKSPVKAVKTMDRIAKKHGVSGVAKTAKAADKKYGIHDDDHNKRKDYVRGVMSNVKEEVDLDEAVSRKHFQQVADVIKSHSDQKKRNELAKHHADIFKKQNPRFDHGKFYSAAGANINKE